MAIERTDFFARKCTPGEKKRIECLNFKLKFVVLVSWSWSRVHTRSRQVPKHGNGRLQNGQFLTPAKVKVNGVSIVVSMTYWGWLDVCFLWLPCVEELSERIEMLTFLWHLLKIKFSILSSKTCRKSDKYFRSLTCPWRPLRPRRPLSSRSHSRRKCLWTL